MLQGERRVLVTAAAQGIGRAVAETFVTKRSKVVATDINEAGLAGSVWRVRGRAGSMCATMQP